jgi:putative oxidoreductase
LARAVRREGCSFHFVHGRTVERVRASPVESRLTFPPKHQPKPHLTPSSPMKIFALFAQLVLGLMFLIFGLDHFLHFIPADLKPVIKSEEAKQFYKLLVDSGYMNVVMGLEIAGGIALMTLRWTNLGVLIVGPILVNIMLYHGFLVKGNYEIPGLAVVLMVIVLARHWKEWQSTLD